MKRLKKFKAQIKLENKLNRKITIKSIKKIKKF